jgi:hypothetical protein
VAALGEVLLVLLAAGSGTAHDLQIRHAATLGPDQRVDVTRIGWALSRAERNGDVRSTAAPRRPKQRLHELTPSGEQRQRAWLLGVPADGAAEDIRTRVLLAVETADRATFDELIAVCLARLETKVLPQHHGGAVSARTARAELAGAEASAELAWLRELSARPRERDRV